MMIHELKTRPAWADHELKLLARDNSFCVYYEITGGHMVVYDSLDPAPDIAALQARVAELEMQIRFMIFDDPNQPVKNLKGLLPDAQIAELEQRHA